MAKIPFTLDTWLKDKSQKVETRDGRPARIICTDRKFGYQIIALAYNKDEDKEVYINVDNSGKAQCESKDDLFIVTPEEELTEFEQAFGIAMMEAPEPEEKEERYLFLKEKSSELLAIARQELQPEIDAEIEKAYKNADGVMYNKGKEDAWRGIDLVLKAEYDKGVAAGERQALNTIPNDEDMKAMLQLEYEKGRADALKDLPRWEKDGIPVGSAAVDISGLGGYDFIRRNGKLLRISSLEKLPGFKEDDHE